VRLVVDEMYSPAIAEQLRARGHDAVAVHEVPGLGGLADVALLQWAHDHERALITENVLPGTSCSVASIRRTTLGDHPRFQRGVPASQSIHGGGAPRGPRPLTLGGRSSGNGRQMAAVSAYRLERDVARCGSNVRSERALRIDVMDNRAVRRAARAIVAAYAVRARGSGEGFRSGSNRFEPPRFRIEAQVAAL
jgi:hypothetical protein